MRDSLATRAVRCALGSSGAVTEASMPSLGANLTAADLALTQAQLDQACGKPKALPPALTLDKPCLKD